MKNQNHKFIHIPSFCGLMAQLNSCLYLYIKKIISVTQRCTTSPGLPQNGGVTDYPPPRDFISGAIAIPDGYTVYFRCQGGNILVGPTNSTCQNGIWSHRPPRCESE